MTGMSDKKMLSEMTDQQLGAAVIEAIQADAKPIKGGYCRGCRHWVLDDTSPWTKPAPPCQTCRLAQSESGRPMASTLAYAIDVENYWADLVTQPDFGCVQWEAKG